MPTELQQEIAEKANKAPRVTPADVEAEIASEHYFTAKNGADHADALNTRAYGTSGKALGLLTFCVLVLKNGFTVTGESACASPENFDADIGRKVARQNAINKVWPLLGFRLRDKLASTPSSHIERMRLELDELGDRTVWLHNFIKFSDTFKALPDLERERLTVQLQAMRTYRSVLAARYDAATST